MWRFILKNWQYVLIGALVLALYIASKNAITNKQKYQREKNNVETLMTDIKHARTQAGEDVATIGELQLTVEEFTRKSPPTLSYGKRRSTEYIHQYHR